MNATAETNPTEPASPATTDGQPPRLSQTCSLCHHYPLSTIPGSGVVWCQHCDTVCSIGPRRGCGSCLNGSAS